MFFSQFIDWIEVVGDRQRRRDVVKRMLDRVRREFSITLRNPQRLRHAFNPRRLRRFLRSFRPPEPPPKGAWQPEAPAGFRVRTYESYDEYVRHQQSKLDTMDLGAYADYHMRFRRVLKQRLKAGHLVTPGMTVLCLGARLGAEVEVFLELGCFAVGVDLNPGPANWYVLYGDFHHLQFATGTVDVVFTNSLDHALDIEKVEREILRVLRPEGRFIVEAVKGREEGGAPRAYESFSWATIDDLAARLGQGGLTHVRRGPFDEPWPGEQLVFRRHHAP